MTTNQLDLVFCVDETGSMGSQITSVQKNVRSIIAAVAEMCGTLRCGLVGFRDHCDAWAVRTHVPLTESRELMERGVAELSPSGGGDRPEAVADGLRVVARLGWNAAAVKVVVLIGDAPPHGLPGVPGDKHPNGCPCGFDFREQVETCRELGISIHTVACRGIGNERYAFEWIASRSRGAIVDLGTSSAELPALIAGAAKREVLRRKLLAQVASTVEDHRDRIKALSFEQDRIGLVARTLQGKGEAAVSDSDVEFAVFLLKREGKISPELFPETGAAVAPKSRSGLFDKSTSAPVWLSRVGCNAKIAFPVGAEVELLQVFENSSDRHVEAVFRLPLDEDVAAVCGFSAEIDGKVTVAKVMTKEKAAAVYSDAVAAGHGAYLVERKSDDLFEINIGSLPPGKTVTTRLTYVTRLTSEGMSCQFVVLSSTAAPRYEAPTVPTPLAAQAATQPLGALRPATFSFFAEINSAPAWGAIDVASPSHTIAVERRPSDGMTSARLEAEKTLDRDLVLVLSCRAISSCVLAQPWEEGGGSIALAPIAVCPTSEKPPTPSDKTEVDIVVDCSASMSGAPMEEARAAVSGAVDAIERFSGAIDFNIFPFGTDTVQLFEHPWSAADPESIHSARSLCTHLLPTLGGSQLAKALQRASSALPLRCPSGHGLSEPDLQWFLSSKPEDQRTFASSCCSVCRQAGTNLASCASCKYQICAGCLVTKVSAQPEPSAVSPPRRAILLITDGNVAMDADAVLRSLSVQLPVFAIGCGRGANRKLLRGIACGRGVAEFASGPSSLPGICARQINRIVATAGDTALNLSWGACKVDFAAQSVPALVPGAMGIWLGLASNLEGLEVAVNSPGLALPLKVAPVASLPPGKLLHRLCAKQLIRGKEMANEEASVVELATKYSLASKFTSFVAVEERRDVIPGSVQRVEVPPAEDEDGDEKGEPTVSIPFSVEHRMHVDFSSEAKFEITPPTAFRHTSHIGYSSHEDFSKPVSLISGEDPGEITDIKKIGEGAFGSVSLAMWKGQRVAVKQCFLDAGSADEFAAAVKKQAGYRHPNLLQVFDIFSAGSNACIILEYLPGCSLMDVLELAEGEGSLRPLFTEQIMAFIIRCLLSCLSYVHATAKCAYAEIKSDNVMLGDQGQVKLQPLSEDKPTRGTIGTPFYAAPELIREMKTPTPMSDVYALGILATEMVCLEPPYMDLPPMKAMFMIVEHGLPPLTQPASEPLKDLISLCTRKIPEERPTVDQLLAHQFIAGCTATTADLAKLVQQVRCSKV